MRLHPLTLCLLAGLLPASAIAAAPQELDDVIVTANRIPTALADSITPAQVIDRDEIERSQARSLPDLLRGRAGLSVANQGGPGKLSTVSIRGTETDHVLVLVDGVRIGSATAGLAAFQDLPVDQIERIEIVRGPRSSLYGSEAIGGVIQIFTRRGRSSAMTPHLRVGIGSHSLYEASAGIDHAGETGWFGAGIAWQKTDGIDACRGTAEGWGAGCFVDEPDRDGYRNTSINLRGGLALTPALGIDAHLLHADARNAFDGSIYGGNEAENLQRIVGTRLQWDAGDRLRITAQLGRANDESENFYADAGAPRAAVGRFDTERDTASLQADIDLATAQRLSLGVDWQRDDVTSDTDYDLTRRRNTGVFAAWLGGFGRHRLEASARHDDNQQFGSHATGALGWGLSLDRGLRLTASAATGFKAPSFNDLYYPFFGNPDLAPEESRSLNLGVSQSTRVFDWSFNLFETRVDDLISYDAAIFLPNNIDEARIRGAELTYATRWAGWDVNGQFSHIDPRNRTAGANHGNLLARRPRNSARIDIDRRFGDFGIGATLNAAGHRYDDAANSARLGGFATTDLRLSWEMSADWTLQGRITNAFDRDYETVAWYNQPGREYGVSLRYQPNRR